MEEGNIRRALELWKMGTEKMLSGNLEEAVELFTQSLETHATAEAYTFRGWAYSFQGRLVEAVLECRKAIATDPDLGNPYNDIGCYLMEQGRPKEAVAWFEKAKAAPRYEARHFPYLNLGRLLVDRGEFGLALLEFEGALAENPDDAVAAKYLHALRYHVN